MILGKEEEKIIQDIDANDLIGLEYHDIIDIEKKTNKYEKENNSKVRKLNNILLKVQKEVDNKEFVIKVLYRFNFIFLNGKISFIAPNKIKGELKTAGLTYECDLEVCEEEITFSSLTSRKDEQKELLGTFKIDEMGNFIIKYLNKETGIERNKSIIYNEIKTVETNEHYNSDGFQTFSEVNTYHEEFTSDVVTGEKTLFESTPFSNYKESVMTWRSSYDYIIKRENKEYLNIPQNNISGIYNSDSCLMGVNIDPTAKKIPNGGIFSSFPKEMFDKLVNGECTILDIKKIAFGPERSRGIEYFN